MPKTGIDEDQNTGLGDHEIWSSVHSDIFSISNPRAPQGQAQRALDVAVALFDSGHDAASDFWPHGVHLTFAI